MQFHAEYNWLNSYLNNDSFWLEDVISWDESFDLLLSDYTIYHFLTSAFFVNSHFFLDSCTKMSFLDVLFFSETDTFNASRELFDFVMWDHLSFISNNFFHSQFLFYTDYQNFFVLVLHNSPELTLALADFMNSYWVSATLSYLPSASFDIFTDTLVTYSEELNTLMILFVIFMWLFILCIAIFRNTKWSNSVDHYLGRINSWLFNLSRENRFQLEALCKVFFLIFFYAGMMILTFDDDQEEGIESFNQFLFYFFGLTIFYVIFQASIHSLSFLEASITEGRTLLFIVSQFRRDIVNVFAILFRCLTLFARLNIYDLNDDITDSYYIFLGDFDDDEYFSDLFFSINSVLFFDNDNLDDRSFFFENEMDISFDPFSLYFIIWGKLALSFFFLIEELARVALALYVMFLIVFEVQSVNRSYVEDNYLTNKSTTFGTNGFNNLK